MLSPLSNAVSPYDRKELKSELSSSDSIYNKGKMDDQTNTPQLEEKTISAASSPSNDQANNRSATSTPKSTVTSAPVLKGSYRMEGGYAVWHGEWGMSEADFTNQGITSKFAYKSQLPVPKANCESTVVDDKMTDGNDIHPSHPACEGLKLTKLENYPCFEPDEISPVFLGYGYSKDPVSSSLKLPHIGHYSGFFNIQVVNAPPQRVQEKDVHLEFVCNSSSSTLYTVIGKGVNKFGSFNLNGSYDTTTEELKVYKIYEPKKLPPRTVKKRRAATKAAKPAPPPSAPTPRISAPTTTAAANTFGTPVSKINVPDETGGGNGSTTNTPTGEPSRSSKRKSVMPFHLREDSVPSRRVKLPEQLKKCQALLKQISTTQWSDPFMHPVDPVALNVPDYFTVITKPMDLGTIKKKLETGEYQNPEEFADDIRLVFDNATTYNRPEHIIHQWAKILLNMFDTKFQEFGFSTAKTETVKHKKPKIAKEKNGSTKARGGKGVRGNTKPASSRKRLEKEAEIEMMKKQIEQMKSQIEMLHSGGAVAVPPAMVSRTSSNQVTTIPVPAPDGDEDNRPMTFEEKRELSLNINRLPDGKLTRVVQIISERVPLNRNQDPNEEIEIDINSFDTPTLRLLQRYVRQCLSSKRKRPSGKPKRPESQLALAKQVEETTQQRIQSVERQLAALDKGYVPSSGGEYMNGGLERSKDVGLEGLPSRPPQAVKKEGSSSSSGSGSDSSSESDSDSSDSDSSQETAALYSSEKVPSGF